MAGNPHTRANWKKKFVLDRKDKDSPLVKFASYAKDKGSAGFRKDLCATDGFNAAFDAELETVNDDKVLEDLTAAERAFCEGWAILARRQCYDTAAGQLDDAKLQTWIDEQLKAPPWPENMSG